MAISASGARKGEWVLSRSSRALAFVDRWLNASLRTNEGTIQDFQWEAVVDEASPCLNK